MTKHSANDVMLVSGLTELAVGAMTGWPMALATEDPERARAVGIRSTARLRQWHLDLIALGALNVLVSMAVPDLPRRVAYPLTLGHLDQRQPVRRARLRAGREGEAALQGRGGGLVRGHQLGLHRRGGHRRAQDAAPFARPARPSSTVITGR